jgi:hypothetical protein
MSKRPATFLLCSPRVRTGAGIKIATTYDSGEPIHNLLNILPTIKNANNFYQIVTDVKENRYPPLKAHYPKSRDTVRHRVSPLRSSSQRKAGSVHPPNILHRGIVAKSVL